MQKEKIMETMDMKRVKEKQTGMDRALDDLRTGDVYRAKDMEDLFRQILG